MYESTAIQALDEIYHGLSGKSLTQESIDDFKLLLSTLGPLSGGDFDAKVIEIRDALEEANEEERINEDELKLHHALQIYFSDLSHHKKLKQAMSPLDYAQIEAEEKELLAWGQAHQNNESVQGLLESINHAEQGIQRIHNQKKELKDNTAFMKNYKVHALENLEQEKQKAFDTLRKLLSSRT